MAINQLCHSRHGPLSCSGTHLLGRPIEKEINPRQSYTTFVKTSHGKHAWNFNGIRSRTYKYEQDGFHRHVVPRLCHLDGSVDGLYRYCGVKHMDVSGTNRSRNRTNNQQRAAKANEPSNTMPPGSKVPGKLSPQEVLHLLFNQKVKQRKEKMEPRDAKHTI
eukprot:621478_1